MSKIASTVPPLDKPIPKPLQRHDFQPSTTEPIVHGTVEPQRAGERYCGEKIAELVLTQGQLAKALAERDALAKALERIETGDLPDGSLVSPNAQQFAAETLAKLERGELRKPGV